MKRVLNYLKQNRLPIPIGLGIKLSKIPFGKRPGIGKLYEIQKKAIHSYSKYTALEKQEFIYRNFYKIFSYSYNEIPFYNKIYKEANIQPSDVRTFFDIQHVPIISKFDLLNSSLEDRSSPLKNRLLVNTGGSSGKSLSFYMDPNRYGNEWAHVHDMWSKFGFKPTDLKLSFDGRAKVSNKIVYDFVRNSLLYDIYADPKVLSVQLIKILERYPIKYLHGYPSAIYEFALYCSTDNVLLNMLKKSLKAAFLSSEYPSPHYRDAIEKIFGIPTQSFYGHTETCVLAVETERFEYQTYQTYGFAESVEIESKNHLVGTSYFNYASPLIRYDTSDLISPTNIENGILNYFKIEEGRLGEYLIDKDNKRIPLTGLIYGRHHDLFNVSEHIQVCQEKPGSALILYVSKQEIPLDIIKTMFNSDNINIDFKFKHLTRPVLSSSGKTNLIVKKENL